MGGGFEGLAWEVGLRGWHGRCVLGGGVGGGFEGVAWEVCSRGWRGRWV